MTKLDWMLVASVFALALAGGVPSELDWEIRRAMRLRRMKRRGGMLL